MVRGGPIYYRADPTAAFEPHDKECNVTVAEASNRGNNLLGTSIVALSACAFGSEFFIEDEVSHKLDEGLLILLGIAALAWYWTGRRRFERSVLPVALVVAALVVKIAGIVLESSDDKDVGDDFGAVILFLVASITVIVIHLRTSQLTSSTA